MKKILRVGVLIFLLVGELSFGLFAQTVRYVKSVEQGTGDGLSWDNASADLSAMLIASGINDEIWVAAGTYVPGHEGSMYETFNIPSGVKLYGGFAGNEMSLDERDPEINLTILSGDIGTENYPYDNIKHIIRIDNSSNNVLDGFIIQDAFCPQSLVITEPVSISGVYPYSSADFCPFTYSVIGEVQSAEPLDACSTIISLEGKIALIQRGSCTFVSKAVKAQNAGAVAVIIFNNVEDIMPGMTGPDSNIVIPVIGISLSAGEFILDELNAGHSVIANIESGQYGGGIYITDSNPIINNCTFKGNHARYGSAIFGQYSSMDITNCLFMQNSSTMSTIFHYESQVNINNCIFNGNNADNGAAIYCSSNSSSTVKHCLFENNFATYSAAAIYNYLGALAVDSCSFIDNKSQYGGAICGSGNLALTSIQYCNFIDNKVTGGGAALIVLKGRASLKNCFIYNNLAQNSDTTLGTAGAIQIQDSAQVEIINSVLSNNQAGGKNDDGGGAISVYSSGKLTINSSTIVNNSTAAWGGAIRIYDSSGFVAINNSILWNNTSLEDSTNCIYNANGMLSINYSDIQDDNLLNGTGNLNIAPLFIDITNPRGADDLGMTPDDGLMLQENSPVINKGDSSATSPVIDIIGNPRVGVFDMGAYEYQPIETNHRPLNEGNIFIYPNPAASIINLNGGEGVRSIIISNIMGQVIWTGNYESFPLNINDWSNGMYIFSCEKDGMIITRKLIKE